MTRHPNQHRAGHGSPIWPPEDVARLIELRDSGLPPSRIAPLMGRTRRSIIGKLDRLKAGEGSGARRRLRDDRQPGDKLAGTRTKLLNAARAKPAWPAERLERLRQLVEVKCLSATQAATELRTTRDAVIGACHRLSIQLPGRSGDTRPARAAKSGKNNNPAGWNGNRERPAAPEPLPAMPACTGRVSIADLGLRHCRYIGERPELITIDTELYCGARTALGSSWCPTHRALVFQPVRGPSARALQRPAG